MKRLNIVVASILVTAILFSCKKTDTTTPGDKEQIIQPTVLSPLPVASCNNYSVTLEKASYYQQKTTFIWKIYNDNVQSVSDLQQWQLIFSDVNTPGSIIGAYFGSSPDNLKPINPLPGYTIDPNDKCWGAESFTFKYGTKDDKPSYYAIVLNGYFTVGPTRVFLTSKGNTDCCDRYIVGIGKAVY
jgi:hypothetical protein